MSITLDRVCHNVCTILINRPSKRNAFNVDLVRIFKDALTQFEEDDSLLAAVISGTGGNFSAGYDLNDLIDPKTGQANMNNLDKMLLPMRSNFSKTKITVAAIEGYAAGFGYELALKCDFRVADRDARMGFMNRRFGIPIMNGGTVMLPKKVGTSRAMELIATGKSQLATEALEYGLLTAISDVGCSFGRAVNLARSLVKFDQSSLIHDLKPLKVETSDEIRSLIEERQSSLDFLSNCGRLESANKFLSGELFRHGKSDQGNLMAPDPVCTL